MAALTNTLINGDLRVTGTIYGSHSHDDKTDFASVTDASIIDNNTSATSVQSYFNNNVTNLRAKVVYKKNSTENLLLFGRGSDEYGVVLKAGYSDEYMYIMRKKNGTWEGGTAWEKIYAGYADSTGKLNTARKTYVTLGTASTSTTRDWSGDTTIPVDGQLNVANGGTGRNSVPADCYLKGNGTNALLARSYEEVRQDLDLSASARNTLEGIAYLNNITTYKKLGTLTVVSTDTDDTCAVFMIHRNWAGADQRTAMLNIDMRYNKANGTYTYAARLNCIASRPSDWSSKLYLYKDSNKIHIYAKGASGSWFSVRLQPIQIGSLSGDNVFDRWTPSVDASPESSISYTALDYECIMQADTLLDFGPSSWKIRAGWSGKSISSVYPNATYSYNSAIDWSTDTTITARHLISAVSETINGTTTVSFKDVDVSNVTVGNATNAAHATYADSLPSVAVGNYSTPVYIKADGKPDTCTSLSLSTTGSAGRLANTSKIGDIDKPVYFTANGVPAVCTSLGSLSTTGSAGSLNLTSQLGSDDRPVYFGSDGKPKLCADRFVYTVQSDGTASTTQYRICVGSVSTASNTISIV